MNYFQVLLYLEQTVLGKYYKILLSNIKKENLHF